MGWTHTADKVVKARKNYYCFLCGRSILADTTYLCRTGIDSEQGRVSCRMHEACERFTKQWDEADWEFHDPSDFAAGLDHKPR